MKHSIRFKITFFLTAMVVLTIFLTWFINRTFLSDFYIHSKVNNLDEVYHKVLDVYSKSDEDYTLSDENTELMEQLAFSYNVDVYIYNSTQGMVYPEADNIGLREKAKMQDTEMFIFGFSNAAFSRRNILKQANNYIIYSIHDYRTDASFIDMVGRIIGNGKTDGASPSPQDNSMRNYGGEDDNIVLLRTNFESIEESVAVANRFLAYVGIVAVILGSTAMFIFSKKFTKPIHELAEIAKSMTDLNFEVKYKVESKDEIGELGKSINTLSDKLESTITELKQANNELLTDIQKKTEIDEMRKEFLSNVSHELKTPISLIQGYAEGLKENVNEDEESRDFYCEVIIDEAGKMNQMVKKLLSLNELEFGSGQVNFERFDIVAMIWTVLSSSEILFRQKEVTLHFGQQEPVYVWADEYLIEQVVTNYISNALNHVSGNRIIEIKLIPREDTVRIAVFNTGENIPEDDLDKIWIKFYKVDKARTREYGGSGIGLSIVKAIMNSHNRECGVINRPVGVEFWFELDTK
ncbi:MAG TPA: HAMP domain-containing protein [Clostridiales bacterium]|nr:HAMP domain-containing protein [Clostridiales bacterium]